MLAGAWDGARPLVLAVAMSQRQRLIGLLIDLAVMGGFGTAMIAAGHGVGPAGLLMFLGQGDWHTPMAVAWSGVAVLMALALVPNRWCYALRPWAWRRACRRHLGSRRVPGGSCGTR